MILSTGVGPRQWEAGGKRYEAGLGPSDPRAAVVREHFAGGLCGPSGGLGLTLDPAGAVLPWLHPHRCPRLSRSENVNFLSPGAVSRLPRT